MSAPTLKVSLGFGSTWTTADASISWTDVTADVHQPSGVSVRRGRSSELDDYRAGTASLTLLNNDRKYDPQHAAGAHYGDLLPGVPIKIEATPAGQALAPVFRGFVDGWPQDYILGNTMAVVNLSATDGFGKLAQAGLAANLFEDYISRTLTPTSWLPLGDAEGSTTAVDRGSLPKSNTVGSAATFGVVGLAPGTATAATFTDGGLASFGVGFPAGSPTQSVVSCVFVIETSSSGAHIYYSGTPDAFKISIGSGFASGNYLEVANSTASVIGTSAAAINDGEPHIVMARIGAGAFLYVDGVDVLSSTGAGFTASPFSPTLGTVDGTLQHVAFDTATWTTTNATDLATLFAATAGDMTGARIGDILDGVGWPSGLRSIATGLSPLGPGEFGGTALTAAKKVEAAEQGRLFMSRDGKVTFLDRYYHQTVTAGSTAQATFSDDGADIGYSSLGYDDGGGFIFNRIRASRPDSDVVEVSDSTSITTYGERVDSSLVDVDFATDSQARSAAEFKLAKYKDVQLRVRPIEVKLHGLTAAQQATILGLELGYRVNVERTPQGVGSAIDRDHTIEGIAHSVGGGAWTTTLTLSPADTIDHAIWGTDVWGTGLWGY